MCNSSALNPADNPLAESISKTDLSGSADTVQKAFQTGNWGEPLGSQASGWDVLGAGPLGMRGIGGSSDEPRDRAVGRAVGSFFAGQGIGQAAGAGGGGGVAAGDAGAAGAEGTGIAADTGSGLSSSASSGSGLSPDIAAAGADGAQGLIAPAGTEFGGGTTTSAIGGGGEILSAGSAMPTFNLSPGTADALGIGGSTTSDLSVGQDVGQGVGQGVGQQSGQAVGQDVTQDPTKPTAGKNTILGLKPTTAALLGISGIQALQKPKQTSADKSLETNSTPAAQQATSVISSGGTATPAWATQKDSIDADIDQQIKDQTQAIIQQAVNAGQGADSMVVKQQVNQLKEKLEAQRQTLYAQQQQKNVQAALSELGISNQALSSVSANQFNNSQQAKQQAAQTASTALLLQALS